MKLTKLISLTGLALATTFVAFAVPPSKQTSPSTPLRTTEDFAQVKPGDKLALVCKECDTVTVRTIATTDEAMEFCKEGAEIACPSCKKSFKVVRHGPRSKGGTHPETQIVNERGEECLFVTKLPD